MFKLRENKKNHPHIEFGLGNPRKILAPILSEKCWRFFDRTLFNQRLLHRTYSFPFFSYSFQFNSTNSSNSFPSIWSGQFRLFKLMRWNAHTHRNFLFSTFFSALLQYKHGKQTSRTAIGKWCFTTRTPYVSVPLYSPFCQGIKLRTATIDVIIKEISSRSNRYREPSNTNHRIATKKNIRIFQVFCYKQQSDKV